MEIERLKYKKGMKNKEIKVFKVENLSSIDKRKCNEQILPSLGLLMV